MIEKNIEKQEKYFLVDSFEHKKLVTAIFSKSSIKANIKDVDHTSMKLNSSKGEGTYGAVVIKLQLFDTSLCFINCYLPPGKSKTSLDLRLQQIDVIHEQAFQKQGMG